jgi:hypothetical protein
MIPFFTEVVGQVTPFALLKILDQYDVLETAEDSQCYHSLQDSLGLPCCHVIADRLRDGGVLHLHDIHQRWHFAKPTSDISSVNTSELLLLNPKVVRGKRRPRGGAGCPNQCVGCARTILGCAGTGRL